MIKNKKIFEQFKIDFLNRKKYLYKILLNFIIKNKNKEILTASDFKKYKEDKNIKCSITSLIRDASESYILYENYTYEVTTKTKILKDNLNQILLKQKCNFYIDGFLQTKIKLKKLSD